MLSITDQLEGDTWVSDKHSCTYSDSCDLRHRTIVVMRHIMIHVILRHRTFVVM